MEHLGKAMCEHIDWFYAVVLEIEGEEGRTSNIIKEEKVVCSSYRERLSWPRTILYWLNRIQNHSKNTSLVCWIIFISFFVVQSVISRIVRRTTINSSKILNYKILLHISFIIFSYLRIETSTFKERIFWLLGLLAL